MQKSMRIVCKIAFGVTREVLTQDLGKYRQRAIELGPQWQEEVRK